MGVLQKSLYAAAAACVCIIGHVAAEELVEEISSELLSQDVDVVSPAETKTSQKSSSKSSSSKPSKSSKKAFQETSTSQISSKTEPFTGKIAGNKVRLRSKAELDSRVIRELHKDDLLVVVGEENGFYAVQPPRGTRAYVFRPYILDNIVEGSRVNVRLEPDTEAPVIAQLKGGDKVENGKICEGNNRWYEIDPPATTCFYVAKEFIQHVGNADYIVMIEQRKHEVGHLLNSAYMTSQAELRKPFEEIDLDRVKQGFEKVVSGYAEFPEYAEKAKKALAMVQDAYVQKKISHLEAKAIDSSASWEVKNAQLNADLELQRQRLENLQEQLAKAATEAGQMIAEAQHPTTEVKTELKPEKAKQDKTAAPEVVQAVASKSIVDFSRIDILPLTDKMRVWAPVEQSLYHVWAMKNGDKSLQEYYQEEAAESMTLTGIVELYNRPVKNRPGDYLLRSNNLPVGYLYSTMVNLEEKLGQQATVRVLARPNNHFAFPAYFVIAVE